VRSRDSSFKWEYPLLSLRASNSFLRLPPCHPATSIPPCIFLLVTRCRRQLRKMWPIQFAFRLRISRSLTLSNTSSFLTWSVQLIFSILLQHHISNISRCFWSTARSVQVSAPYIAMLQTCSLYTRYLKFVDLRNKNSLTSQNLLSFFWRNSPLPSPPSVCLDLLIHEVSRSHTTTHHSR
jgi:hypothetical protein